MTPEEERIVALEQQVARLQERHEVVERVVFGSVGVVLLLILTAVVALVVRGG